MPYKESHKRTTSSLLEGTFLTKTSDEWRPTLSQVSANQRLGFQRVSDKMSGGIQYWHRKTLKQDATPLSEANSFNNFSTHRSKCATCGGFVSDPAKLGSVMYYTESDKKCAFGRQYCDIIGPCAGCCLLKQRNAIVKKQGVEFPELEVTPRRLVAPALVQAMMGKNRTIDDTDSRCENGKHRNVLKLPPISCNTSRYMRTTAGNRKQKPKPFSTDQEITIKKYIEIRLPNI